MDKIVRLYAPAIVLFIMAIGKALNAVGHTHGVFYFVLAIAVVLHVRAVTHHA